MKSIIFYFMTPLTNDLGLHQDL